MKLKAQFICSNSAAGNIYSETNRLSISQLNCRYAATALSNRPDELHTLYSKQQCIGDDTKDAGRRSPNCIRKTKNTFCGTQVSVTLPKFCENCFSTQNVTEIGQSVAELWPKTIFNMAAVPHLEF